MTFTPVKDGEWVQPVRRGYKVKCCDCGLVHHMDFRIVDARTGRLTPGQKVQFRAVRNKRSTANARRGKFGREMVW